MRWTPRTVALLFLMNITGSGKFARRYYLAQGYDVHPTVKFGGGAHLDCDKPERVHVGRDVVLGHGCMILSHGPGVHGEAIIEDGAYIGAGAIVLGVRVGTNALVGAGAVVRKDVPAGAVVK